MIPCGREGVHYDPNLDPALFQPQVVPGSQIGACMVYSGMNLRLENDQ